MSLNVTLVCYHHASDASCYGAINLICLRRPVILSSLAHLYPPTALTSKLNSPACASSPFRTISPSSATAPARSAPRQGLTLVHVTAQLEQLQDTFMN